MSTVKIRFSNNDATPKEVAFDVSKNGVAPVMAWYGGYHSGDDYTVFVDGVEVAKDPNGELVDYETDKANLEAYGMKIVTWLEFEEATDRPEGLMERALAVTAARPEDRCWVVYDPEGDFEGWMLIGARDEIARETVKDIITLEPPEGPLSPKELARG